ncbi:hypothetical protein CXF97_13155 [Pseudomonas sp. Choline-02u-1]|uniref:hypothetical protein n=1 Tax=Pseudomonas sp. Choline-02u-1 TaxID=2058307 RepID=UPI000C329EE1|nr:hypothetical protein [Pseudomonas sp. Choline-02u-1]PKH81868.1 hypothetical protein CXF97_13155 [Pseudomonas sp. Choline-02u-1]
MSEEKNAFRDAAIEAISDMAQHLPLDCELLVVACRPGKKDFDLVLPSPESNLNNALDALRRNGLSIDGDNAYKRDLLDVVVGALALGAQNSNPPPSSHWATRFWEIGREERELHEDLVAALKLTRENLRACQATIHLAGGFDPAYVNDAQAAMKVADAVLAKAGA